MQEQGSRLVQGGDATVGKADSADQGVGKIKRKSQAERPEDEEFAQLTAGE